MNKNLKKTVYLLPVVMLLPACSGDFFTARMDKLPNSQLVIHETILIQPTQTRTFIQHGKTGGFDHTSPACSLEVRKRDDDNQQTIQPGSYTITGMRPTSEQVVLFGKQETQVAFNGLNTENMKFAMFPNSSRDIHLGLQFNLSGQDANVMRLSCWGGYAAEYEAKRPRLNEINPILGNLMTLHY